MEEGQKKGRGETYNFNLYNFFKWLKSKLFKLHVHFTNVPELFLYMI